MRVAAASALVVTVTAALLSGGMVVPAASAHAAVPTAEECRPWANDRLPENPSAFASLGITDAWRLSQGAVRVAVVDSGVDSSNPHLADAVDPGTDLTGEGDGRTDSYGRGTAIAAIIAARRVQGSGLLGVAPSARIVPVRAFTTLDPESAPTPDRIAEGIVWAAGQDRVRVIVIPFASEADTPALRRAVADATARGVLVVAAAGDRSGDEDAVQFPAGYPQALSVTGTDAAGRAGESVRQGTHVELAAPGADVLTVLGGSDCRTALSGPSSEYAAAYAAGAAALVAGVHRAETPADWEYRLLATALRPAGAGRSTALGWGILAPYEAINLVNDGSRGGPPNPRFGAPAEQVRPTMPRPDAAPNHALTVRWVLGILGLGGLALVIGGLMTARLGGGARRRRPVRIRPSRARGGGPRS